MCVALLTDRITNKSEKSSLINAHAPSREPVPLKTAKGCSKSNTLKDHSTQQYS